MWIAGGASWGALTKAQQREMDEVLRLWRSAAEQGHAEAQFNLGCMYDNGKGVQQKLLRGTALAVQGGRARTREGEGPQARRR